MHRTSRNQEFFENIAQGHYKTSVFESEGDPGATEGLGEGQGRSRRLSGAQAEGRERSAGQGSHRTAQGCPVGRRRVQDSATGVQAGTGSTEELRDAQGEGGDGKMGGAQDRA